MTKRLIWGVISLVICLAVSLPVGVAASVKVYHQHASALIWHPSRVRKVNDSKVHYVKVPKSYAHVKLNHGVDQIKAYAGKKVTFRSKLLLPEPGKNNQRWGNPQSIALSKSGYMYIVYCPTNLKNRGRIVRYNLKRLNQLGVVQGSTALRKAYVKHHGKYTQSQKNIQRAIKVGGLFDTGHGQSLAYNLKSHSLYMWRDNEKKARVPVSSTGYIQHISVRTLKPDRAISFHLRSHGAYIYGGHTLTFDKYGNAYFWSNPGNGVNVYKGRISKHHVVFRRTDQILKKRPGTRIQSMGYNPKRGRLYLVSDDSIASFPAKRLKGHGSLTKGSFEWSGLSPKRETEGLAYDSKGHGYLLSNHHPEVLESTTVY